MSADQKRIGKQPEAGKWPDFGYHFQAYWGHPGFCLRNVSPKIAWVLPAAQDTVRSEAVDAPAPRTIRHSLNAGEATVPQKSWQHRQ